MSRASSMERCGTAPSTQELETRSALCVLRHRRKAHSSGVGTGGPGPPNNLAIYVTVYAQRNHISKNPLFSRFHSFNILRIDRSKFDTDPTSTKRATAVFMSTGQTIDMSFIYGQTTQLSETAIFVLGNNFLSFWRNEICAWLGVGSSMLTMYIAISFNFLLSSMCTIHSSIMLKKNLVQTWQRIHLGVHIPCLLLHSWVLQ